VIYFYFVAYAAMIACLVLAVVGLGISVFDRNLDDK
jgi:hypothetical protein